MDGVRLGREELIATYGVSQRLAVRIGALLGKGLEVTAALLEIAGPGSAMEKLLLHPDTLRRADELDTDGVRRLAQETGASREGELVIQQTARGRVLALEEELLAEKGWQETAQPEATAVVRPVGGAAPAVLGRHEVRGIFTTEEIARLKLEALAGATSDARISALRKLVFSPLNSQEKGGIYLRALLDPSVQVRAEAVKAIESLGFNRDTADAIQAFFSGDARARHAALRRIGDLLGSLQAAERTVVLAVLLEAFRETRLTGPYDPLLRLFEQAAPALSAHPEVVPEMIRVCVQHLLLEPGQPNRGVADLILRLAEISPEAALSRLWEEALTVTEPLPRAGLLELLIEIEKNKEHLPRLCELIVEELVREGHEEVTRQKLGHHLSTVGVEAARSLQRRFAAASNPERARLAPFLDIMGSDRGLPTDEVNAIAEQLAGALKVADRPLRSAILQSRFFTRAEVDLRWKKALVAELLPMLQTQDSPDAADQAARLLEALGDMAAAGVFEIVRARPASPEADAAARILGRVLGRADAHSRTASDLTPAVFQFLCRRVALPANTQGGYAYALGHLVNSPAVSAEYAQSALDLLMKRVGRVRYHGELVEAIGRVAAHRAVHHEGRVRAAHLLLSLVQPPERAEKVTMREITTAKGRTFEITGRIEFDSETLPAAVIGLEALALASSATPALRDQIVRQLLKVWDGVARWSVVWGPRGSEALARALGRIGADRRVGDDFRARTVAALALAAERPSVVRALKDALSVPSSSPEFNHAAVETALRLLDQWIVPEITQEELSRVVVTAALAAAAPDLNSRNPRVRALRERTVALLLDALRADQPWAREPLERLRDCPSIPRRLRSDIQDRLERAGALRLSIAPTRRRKA